MNSQPQKDNFDYSRADFEEVPCNLCGANYFFILSGRAANGRPAQTCLCRRCGLIYINPRLSISDYDSYYRYFYRKDRALSKGLDVDQNELKINFDQSQRFGKALGHRFKDAINSAGLTLDVGSSTGGVLYGLKTSFPRLEILGVEPSVQETDFANTHGIKTHLGLFEDLSARGILPTGDYSNILCLRTLNHLLDPKGFFNWAFKNLRTGGCLILEVKNFRHQARRSGNIESGVQIDHPYMFTPETLVSLVKAEGFKIAALDVDELKDKASAIRQKEGGLSVHHIRLSAQKIEKRAVKLEINNRFPKKIYWQMRLQFFRPYIKLIYFLYYSSKFSFLRSFFPFLNRN